MDKQKLIVIVAGLAVVFFLYFFSTDNAEKDKPIDWEAKYKSLLANYNLLIKENDTLKTKNANIHSDQQKLSQNAEAFLRAYFTFDQNTRDHLRDRVAPYATPNFINTLPPPTMDGPEGEIKGDSEAPAPPSFIRSKLDKVQIYFSLSTNTTARVIAIISQNVQIPKISTIEEQYIELSLLYNTNSQTWLVDNMKFLPIKPTDDE